MEPLWTLQQEVGIIPGGYNEIRTVQIIRTKFSQHP